MLIKALPKPPKWPAGFVNWVCATEQQRCRQQSHLNGEHFHFLFGKGIWNVAFEVGEGCLWGAAGWMGWVGSRPAVLRKAACAALCHNVSRGQCCLLGSALRSGVRKIQNVSWSGVTSQKQINNAPARSCSNLQRIVSLRVCPLLWPWLVLFTIQRVVWGINSKETPAILLRNFLKDFLTAEERRKWVRPARISVPAELPSENTERYLQRLPGSRADPFRPRLAGLLRTRGANKRTQVSSPLPSALIN